jgi:hypothetical protein
MKWLLCLIAVVTLSAAQANSVPRMPLEELVRKSDIVVVAIVRNHSDVVANVGVLTVLKGQDIAQFELKFEAGIAEMHPDCCIDGARYLMFLKKTRDGYLIPVNGPFGIVSIDSSTKPSNAIRALP